MTDYDDDLTPEQIANIEYDVDTAMQNAWAIHELTQLGAKAINHIERTFSPALTGRRVQACLHAIDAAYTPNVGHPVVGQGAESDLRAYLCLDHPDRLMCDKPRDKYGPGCLTGHLEREHEEQMRNITCFVYKQPIPDDTWTPVNGSIKLQDELPVYPSHDRMFTYRGFIEVLPWAFLCIRHSGAVDLPVRMEWRLVQPR